MSGGVVWLMETNYVRRASVPRSWHAHPAPATQDGPSTAVCGAAIRNAASAHREESLADLERSHRTRRWRHVCSHCRSRLP
jgi:hypothetical protein